VIAGSVITSPPPPFSQPRFEQGPPARAQQLTGVAGLHWGAPGAGLCSIARRMCVHSALSVHSGKDAVGYMRLSNANPQLTKKPATAPASGLAWLRNAPVPITFVGVQNEPGKVTSAAAQQHACQVRASVTWHAASCVFWLGHTMCGTHARRPHKACMFAWVCLVCLQGRCGPDEPMGRPCDDCSAPVRKPSARGVGAFYMPTGSPNTLTSIREV
jgi:hypothetical protein